MLISVIVIPREGVESLKLLIMFGEMLIDRVIPREGVESGSGASVTKRAVFCCDPERGS